METIRSRKLSERQQRKSRISTLKETETAEAEEKEIEALREDVASMHQTDTTTKLPNCLPSALPIPIPPTNSTSQLMLQSQQPSTMAVLTPIQSSLIEEPKKQDTTNSINLSEFEGFSSTPFEEMELKTLNDKEELAMLLQPNSVPQTTNSSYGMQNMYASNYHHSGWTGMLTESYTQPTMVHHYAPANWPVNSNHIPNSFLDHQVSGKPSLKSSYSGSSTGTPNGNLRQAKSVPDLTEMSISNDQPVATSSASSVSPNKRLSSRTPPPRLSSSSISKHIVKPPTVHKHEPVVDNAVAQLEKHFNDSEKRLVQQLTDMGFPRDRAVKAVRRVGGGNEKNAVDQLLIIQRFVDLGHQYEHIELALETLKMEKEWQKQLQKHLELFHQLLALGFPQERIGSALVAAGHDRDKALDILLMM